MKKPRFSIIIPTLNEEKFVPKLLQSLTEQSVKDFDVVVVDGKSKDRTVAVVNKFVGKLPLTVEVSEKTGVSVQRNMGAKIGKADWLVFVDADGVLLPNFIERIGSFIDRKHPKIFTSWLKADGDEAMDSIGGFLLNISIEATVLIDRPWAPGPLTVVRRDVFDMVGGYDEEASYGEDHDLSMKIYKRGIPFDILREILYIYSLRRFRKEGSIKVVERNFKSLLNIIVTGKAIKQIPGFIGGGSIYQDGLQKKKKDALLFGKLALSVKKFIGEFIA
jgi:glycosyltransferase involved in cell wall biosynthesis